MLRGNIELKGRNREEMATFAKTVLKTGSGSIKPAVGASVTVHADLYLRDAKAAEDKGTAIWSTTKAKGFLFPAASGIHLIVI